MRRVIVGLCALVVFAGCGSTQPKHPTVARELRQPAAPVVTPSVHRVAVPANAGPEGHDDGLVAAAGATCGRERWNVKTATDPAAGQIKLAPVKVTVAALGALASTNPANPDQPRDPATESTVYEVTAELVEAKREADSDFHLVLAEGGARMIAEIPDAPGCTEPPVTGRVSVLERQIEQARAAFVQAFGEPQSYPSAGLAIHRTVTLTGVGFFDKKHGQAGVAENGVELHPVLSLAP